MVADLAAVVTPIGTFGKITVNLLGAVCPAPQTSPMPRPASPSKATHALLRSLQFDCVWSENPDRDPPPGREFAQAMAEQINASGDLGLCPKVGDRDWEHSSWFFNFRWQKQAFCLWLEPSVQDLEPPLWHLAVSKDCGFLRAFFGGNKGRHDVPDDLLSLVDLAAQKVARCAPLEWISRKIRQSRPFGELRVRQHEASTAVRSPLEQGWL